MPKQVNKYIQERNDILNKLFSILGINESNNTFLLHELDSNIDKQNQIFELETEIKKFFLCGKWSCFKDPNMKRKYLSFIKHMMKDMGYEIFSVRKFFKNDDNTNYRDTVYNVVKKN
jgi:hypothetical protein